MTSFLSFFSLSKVTTMCSTYLEYLKYRYESKKFSKIRLILANFLKSGHLWLADNFLHQWCALIVETTVVSFHLLYCAGHMYLRGKCIQQVDIWYFFSLSGFLLKMILVMNDCTEKLWSNFTAIKKIVTYLTKTLKRLWYDIITKSTVSK